MLRFGITCDLLHGSNTRTFDQHGRALKFRLQQFPGEAFHALGRLREFATRLNKARKVVSRVRADGKNTVKTVQVLSTGIANKIRWK